MKHTIAIKTTAGACALAVVVALAGCGSAPEAAPSAPSPVATATTTARPTPAVDVPVAAATAAPAPARIAPERVVIASLGVDVPAVPVGVEPGGFMELPTDPAVAGWYRFGSDPGSAQGNTVISAHVDAPDYPIGPFSRLRDLAPGAMIEVTDARDAVHRYSVQSVTYFAKAELPVDELFEREGVPKLVLITCGGEFDSRTGRYADNVVVVAAPTS